MKRIKKKLKSKKIRFNGSVQIVENIVKNYEKN